MLHRIKMFYLSKIKKMNHSEIMIDHLRKLGMKIGKGCFIFSDKVEGNEPYLVTIGNDVMIAADVRFLTHDSSVQYYID